MWAKADTLDDATHSNVAGNRHGLLRAHHASAALPADLRQVSVFHQYRNRTLSAGQGDHPSAGTRIGLYVVFHVIAPLPIQPLAHLLSVGTTGGSVQFEFSHGSTSPKFGAGRDTSTLAPPESAECNPSGPPD